MIIRKKYLFYVLAITSSFIAAAVTGIDSYVGSLPVFKYDPWAFAFALFFIGTIITLLITLVLSIKIKGESLGARILDPSFKRIRIVHKNEMKYHFIAGLVNAINPGSFYASSVHNPTGVFTFPDFIYYSFVTLATLGYGDITPLTAQARSLAILETASGTIYIAVLIARLVGALRQSEGDR